MENDDDDFEKTGEKQHALSSCREEKKKTKNFGNCGK